jgi:AAA family ATP:ADP antiporter
VLLELVTQCMRRLPTVGDAANRDRAVGGGIFDGMKRALSNPFLLAICAQILLFAITSTFLYSRQGQILEALVPSAGERTRIFALHDLAVNIAALVLQAFATGRIMTYLGLGVALALTPLVTLGSFTTLLIAAPSVVLVVALHAARRAVHFAFDRPSREVLFTTVSRDDKYKAKSFIDTVVFRGGDSVGAWTYAGLGALAMPAAIPISLAWLAVALYLSRAHARRAKPPGAHP